MKNTGLIICQFISNISQRRLFDHIRFICKIVFCDECHDNQNRTYSEYSLIDIGIKCFKYNPVADDSFYDMLLLRALCEGV